MLTKCQKGASLVGRGVMRMTFSTAILPAASYESEKQLIVLFFKDYCFHTFNITGNTPAPVMVLISDVTVLQTVFQLLCRENTVPFSLKFC